MIWLAVAAVGALLAVLFLPLLTAVRVSAAEAEPWDAGAAWPAMTAASKLAKGQTYFTGKEWTGETSPVKQADVFGVNREPAHASDVIPYSGVEAARTGIAAMNSAGSDRVQMLTGAGQPWALTVYRNLADAQAAGVATGFYAPGYTTADKPYTGKGEVTDYKNADYACGWRNVTLPASWQTQGFDFAIYSNIDTPWKGVYGNEGAGVADKNLVPKAPTVFNPVGFYRRTFDVDAAWVAAGQKVFLSFQGVESAYYVYVNGHEVGYSEDSYDAHDFDITPFLNSDGRGNVLAVRVHRWCDGSWLEDQDFLRMGGIFRDVFLYSTPAVYIRDYKVETPLDAAFANATLNLKIDVANSSTAAAGSFAVDVRLYDAAGVNLFGATPLRQDVGSIAAGQSGSVSLSRQLIAPRLWSDEDPYLYTLVITLYDAAGRKLFESVGQQLGVREIQFTKTKVDSSFNKTATAYQQILLNGKPLIFRGANRHDNDPHTGKYVSPALYEQDILIMKQNNINAVRTSHYPDARDFYWLCDQYGILVMAETNAESHSLQNDSDVMAQHLTNVYSDRLTANVQAQKNRASVVMWSLGNECGDTSGSKMFQKAIQNVLRPLDSTRPVHYEGLQNRGGVDVYSNMYPSVETVAGRGLDADRMPYVMCEYVFGQGNSIGNLQEYWDAIRQGDNQIGAFIWDYVDKSLAMPLPRREAYAVDRSARGYTAQVEGGIAAAPTFGRALTGGASFPDTVSGDDPLNQTLSGRNSFTVELQVRPHANGGEYNILAAKGDDQFSVRVYQGNRLDAVFKCGGEWKVYGFSLPAGWWDNWHQLAVTFDGSLPAMYVDGTALTRSGSTAAVSADVNRTADPFALNRDTQTGRTGASDIAFARVYARVLTAAELAAQSGADKGSGSYAIPADNAAVRLWADFTRELSATASDYWDYYASVGRADMAGKFFSYGGDWGDIINSGSYLGDGVISADRTVQPEMQEVKYVYQPLIFTADTAQLLKGEVTVRNDQRFTDMSKYTLLWELVEDGAVISSGTLNSVIPPMSEAAVSVPFALPAGIKAGSEYFLNLKAVLTSAAPYAPAGHVAAWKQFALPVTVLQGAKAGTGGAPALTSQDAGGKLTVTGGDFTLTFDKAAGCISSYVYKGKTVLTQGPVPNYWRAKMDSDYQNSEWQSANQNMQVTSMTATPAADGKSLKVAVTLTLPNAKSSVQRMTYTVYASGEIHVDAALEAKAGLGELLKYGAALTLPGGYEALSWYGEGPADTFADRRQGGTVGVWSTTVSDEFFPYLRPQTSGNHTGVRYITLEQAGNPVGLAVVGENPLEASASHFTVADYAGKKHPYEMPRTDYTILNIDQISAGLGGASCGPATLSKYRLQASGDYHYAYTIMPYIVGTDNVMERSKAWRRVDSFDQAAFDKTEVRRVEGLIEEVNYLLSVSQKPAVQAARAAYNALSAAQRAQVRNTATLLYAEQYIDTLAGTQSFIKDSGARALDGAFDGTLRVKRDLTSPTGYSMRGWYTVPDRTLMDKTFSGRNSFTLEVWVKPEDFEDNNTFIAKGDFQVALKTKEGSLEFMVYDGAWQVLNPKGVAGLTANAWHHVAGTFEEGQMRLYLDGRLIGQKTVSGSVRTDTTVDMGIGRYANADYASRALRGELGAARAYTRALTAEEIAARYAADIGDGAGGVPPEDASVLFWYDMAGYHTGAALPQPPPPLEPDEVEPPLPVFTRGDVDDDGSIDSTDARLVLQHEVKLITLEGGALLAADASKDGKVDSTDARMILQHEVKLITITA